jgi:hypothetical protein
VTILEESAASAIDAAGKVTVPEETVNPAAAVNSPDVVMVLLVNVSVPAKVANVFVPVGNVRVPLFEIVAIIGAVSVLFVKVSAPAKVANVFGPVGNVRVPLFEIVAITGAVNVLFVSVCVPTKVAILEDSAASAIDAAGNVTVTAEIANPFPDVNLPFNVTFPFNETSPTTNNLPPIETSDPTYNRVLIDASLDKNKRPFIETSSAIIN